MRRITLFAAFLLLALTVPVGVAAAPDKVPSVIYDSDMDFDDASTLALLCQQHKQHLVRLRAVTIVNDGMGTRGRSLVHARTILDRCGLPDLPVADGADAGVNPGPPETRSVVEKVLTDTLSDAAKPAPPTAGTAAQLISAVALSSPVPVTVLTTGPLSNLAAVLRSAEGPAVAAKIGRVYSMGGAFSVGGNLFGSTVGGFDNSQEMNMWLDPPADATVFSTLRPQTVRLVPLDATSAVPITKTFVDTLGVNAETDEARLVHGIVTHPDLAPLVAAGALFWWDPLTALSISDADLVGYRGTAVSVVQSGASSGRTVASAGGPVQYVGTGADRQGFETVFLDTLNGG